MQNWTTEMWQAAGIGLVIGLILGYLFLRLTKGSVKNNFKRKLNYRKSKIN